MDTLSMPLLCASDSFNSKQQHHVLDLSELSIIAPPPLVNHDHHTAEEQQETSSNESSNGDAYAYAGGSGFDTVTTATSSASSSSFSTGQLTPPFSSSSSCSCSSSLNIADHGHHHRHEDAQLLDDSNNNTTAAAADLQDEDVDDSFPNSRTRQSTASKAGIKSRKGKNSNNVSRSDVRRYAAEIVRREAKALLDLASRLDPEEQEDEDQGEFDDDDESISSPSLSSRFSLKAPEKQHDGYSKAVELLKNMDSHGRIIMTGVGKSGLLARKAVATFNSFGIPSAFLHPVEALHGDLGSISPYGVDTVILISYSGRTSELLHLLNHLRQRRVHACISLSSPDSALAEACDVNIDVSLENDEEAEDCVPAPTSSVVTALAALDALALTLLRLKTGWHSHISERRKAFGLHHPGGSLGQQLSSTLEQT